MVSSYTIVSCIHADGEKEVSICSPKKLREKEVHQALATRFYHTTGSGDSSTCAHPTIDVTYPSHHAVCVTPDDIRQRVQAQPSELPKGWAVIESPPSKLILAKPV